MFQDAYVKLNTAETNKLVAALKPFFDGAAFEAASTIIMARNLPFYNGWRFLDVTDHRFMPPSRRFVLQKDDDFIVLDFTNAPIYALNEKSPIYLEPHTLADYVRFFFSFVRGRHGRFIIVESIDDIAWREEPAPTARKAISKLIQPINFIGTSLDGAYHLSAQMMFKDSLFKADIFIKPNGEVKITNEELLVEDMPVLDDTFGQ